MVIVTTTKEIASCPAHVRRIFLDFQRLPQWTQAQFKSITPQTPKPGIQLQAGDKLNVRLEGMSFSPVILENTPSQFKWRGSIPFLLSGDHFFRFQPSESTPGGTTFVHGEEFTGLLAMPFAWFGAGRKAGPGFERFNEDLKREAEREVGE